MHAVIQQKYTCHKKLLADHAIRALFPLLISISFTVCTLLVFQLLSLRTSFNAKSLKNSANNENFNANARHHDGFSDSFPCLRSCLVNLHSTQCNLEQNCACLGQSRSRNIVTYTISSITC